MALLSPGVEVIEKDMSLTVSTAGSSYGAYAASFKKGEAGKAKLIGNEAALKDMFGLPDNDTYKDFMVLSHFLMYTDSLYVVRAVDDTYNVSEEVTGISAESYDNNEKKITFNVDPTNILKIGCMYSFGLTGDGIYTLKSIDSASKTATFVESIKESIVSGTKVFQRTGSQNAFCEIQKKGAAKITSKESNALLFKNAEEYDTRKVGIPVSHKDTKLRFTAKNPGLWGNEISIAIANPSDFENNATIKEGVSVNDLVQYAPVGKQFVVVVYSGKNIAETFSVSWDPNETDDFGKTLYCEEVINRNSSYVFCKNNTSIANAPESCLMDNIVSLKYGADGAPSKANLAASLDVFRDPETIDIDIIMANEKIYTECIQLAEERGDCITYVGTPESEILGLKTDKILENELKFRQSLGNSKFATYVENYISVYDKYNDTFRWVSPIGYCAGLRANTNNTNGYWYASAGLDYGQLTGVTQIAWNPTKTHRDALYKADINAICSFPNQGVVLWGQKTLYGKPSAFDRVNVRMLFNYLERTIAKSSKYVLFTQNDEITRNKFISMVDPVFSMVKSKRGIDDYKIVCDTTNNTPIVIQNNQFVATFLIKPTYVAEFITLNFVAVGASVSFDEAIGAV